MTQQQFEKLEKLIMSIKCIDKSFINDKTFNYAICEILNIQNNAYVSKNDDEPLKNFILNEENPELKKINEDLKKINPFLYENEQGIRINDFQYNGVDKMKFNPYCTEISSTDNTDNVFVVTIC